MTLSKSGKKQKKEHWENGYHQSARSVKLHRIRLIYREKKTKEDWAWWRSSNLKEEKSNSSKRWCLTLWKSNHKSGQLFRLCPKLSTKILWCLKMWETMTSTISNCKNLPITMIWHSLMKSNRFLTTQTSMTKRIRIWCLFSDSWSKSSDTWPSQINTG